MSTSTRGGLALGMPATAAALDDRAARTSEWMGVTNNVNHTADQRSRVLVCYPARSLTAGGLSVKGTSASTWVRAYSWGPFPVLVGSDGLPYPIRARIGGRSIGGATSKLRIGVCAVGNAPTDMAATTAPANVIETATFTDAANAWRAPTVADQLLALDALHLSLSAQALPIVDAVSSASPRTVAAAMFTIEAYVHSTTAASCVCTQVYAAEYVGTVAT